MFSSPFILLVLLSYFSTNFIIFDEYQDLHNSRPQKSRTRCWWLSWIWHHSPRWDNNRYASPPHLPSHITSPHLTSHHLTSPHLTSPHLTSPHLTSPHLTSPHLTSHHITSHHITSPNLISSRLIWSYLIPSHLIPSCRMYTYHWENGCWGQHPRGFGTVGSKHFVGRNTQGITSPTNLPSSTHPFTTTHHLLHFIVRPLHWPTVS